MGAASLEIIAENFAKEAKSIESWFLRSTTEPVVQNAPRPYSPHSDGCVVSLWDAWNRFIRQLMLTCASGPCSGFSSTLYTPATARTEQQALQRLEAQKSLATRKYALSFGKKGEPKWYLVQHSHEIASTLGLQNASTISSSLTSSHVNLGSTTSIASPISSIHSVRNYIAHKSAENLRKADGRAGIKSHTDVDLYLRSKSMGGASRFCDWTEGLTAIARAAVL